MMANWFGFDRTARDGETGCGCPRSAGVGVGDRRNTRINGLLVQFRLMLHRVFTLFLTAVLFWSAFASQELPLPASSHPMEIELVDGRGGNAASGSVDEHHLDDQPGQPSGETASDLPEWFPAQSQVFLTAIDPAATAIAPPAWHLLMISNAPRRPPRV